MAQPRGLLRSPTFFTWFYAGCASVFPTKTRPDWAWGAGATQEWAGSTTVRTELSRVRSRAPCGWSPGPGEPDGPVCVAFEKHDRAKSED